MAGNSTSQLDKLAEVPAWQLALGWVAGAALIGLGWYFLYYSEAQLANKQASDQLAKAKTDVGAAEQRLVHYEQRVKEQAEKDKELKKMLEIVPVDSATIDHLMGTFQREAQGVGLELERWVPQPEEREDTYSKIPVEVTAIGTWHEMGEFFRRVAEMKQVVNVEAITMKLDKEFDATGFPQLKIDFTASTFRLLTETEQNSAPDEGETRRKGKGKKK
ncbi:type 4a pilus biogenesis protein PilO [Nannocystaceae bacterium ST9]